MNINNLFHRKLSVYYFFLKLYFRKKVFSEKTSKNRFLLGNDHILEEGASYCIKRHDLFPDHKLGIKKYSFIKLLFRGKHNFPRKL